MCGHEKLDDDSLVYNVPPNESAPKRFCVEPCKGTVFKRVDVLRGFELVRRTWAAELPLPWLCLEFNTFSQKKLP